MNNDMINRVSNGNMCARFDKEQVVSVATPWRGFLLYKKIVGLIMLMVAVAAVMPIMAYEWYDETTGYAWTYYSNGETATVYGVSPSTGDVAIPSALGGYPVTSIGVRVFEDCGELTSVTIPDSVTSIGDFAFDGCSGLTRVTIGKGVRSIGEFAFVWCGKQMYVIFNGDAPDFDIDMTFDEGCTLYVHRGSTGWDGLRAKFDLNIQYISDTAVATNVKSQAGTPTGTRSALGSLQKGFYRLCGCCARAQRRSGSGALLTTIGVSSCGG